MPRSIIIAGGGGSTSAESVSVFQWWRTKTTPASEMARVLGTPQSVWGGANVPVCKERSETSHKPSFPPSAILMVISLASEQKQVAKVVNLAKLMNSGFYTVWYIDLQNAPDFWFFFLKKIIASHCFLLLFALYTHTTHTQREAERERERACVRLIPGDALPPCSLQASLAHQVA